MSCMALIGDGIERLDLELIRCSDKMHGLRTQMSSYYFLDMLLVLSASSSHPELFVPFDKIEATA